MVEKDIKIARSAIALMLEDVIKTLQVERNIKANLFKNDSSNEFNRCYIEVTLPSRKDDAKECAEVGEFIDAFFKESYHIDPHTLCHEVMPSGKAMFHVAFFYNRILEQLKGK